MSRWLEGYKSLIQADTHLGASIESLVKARAAAIGVVSPPPLLPARLRDAVDTLEEYRREVRKTISLVEQLNDAGGEHEQG